jgi:hypothetical protein
MRYAVVISGIGNPSSRSPIKCNSIVSRSIIRFLNRC